MIKHEKFEDFIRRMDETYDEIDKLDDPVVKTIIMRTTKRARLLTQINFGLGVMVCGFFAIYPFLAGRSLPYGLWIPGLDTLSMPIYAVVYIIEVCCIIYV